MNTSDFVGSWVLEAANSQGDRARLLRIARLPTGALRLSLRRVSREGEEGLTHFETVADGIRRTFEGGFALCSRVEAGEGGTDLVTEVFRDGKRVHWALRGLREDGGVLEERVEERGSDGATETTVARYRRARLKQVICYRRDLKMRKGKIAAQVAHASIGVFLRRNEGTLERIVVPLEGLMSAWVYGGSAKVVLSVDGEAELLAVEAAAKARGIPCCLVTDAGKTEFHGIPTRTTVALGPWDVEEIDAITGPEGLVQTKLA